MLVCHLQSKDIYPGGSVLTNTVLATQLSMPAATTTGTSATQTTTGLGFADLVDVVNPLQHIPVISNIYREMSGDTIHPVMQVAGGALFGGPIGVVLSLLGTIIDSYKEDAVETNDVEMIAGESNGQRPGGWIVNTTYREIESMGNINQDESYAGTHTISGENSTRPGGWIVAATYRERV